MNERVVPKKTNFCVAYMDVAGGVPMRGVSRSGSFVKLSNSPAKAGPMSGAQPMSEASALAAAIALGLTCVPRLELDGPTHRHFESQHDSPGINQRLPN
jgi:hypothetical protein